jgi:hypothetical protein
MLTTNLAKANIKLLKMKSAGAAMVTEAAVAAGAVVVVGAVVLEGAAAVPMTRNMNGCLPRPPTPSSIPPKATT